jgi:CIC family chloride channel protein
VGLVGYFVPQILGVGYDHVSALLNGEMAIRLAALLVVLKLITVVASSGTGNAGGIFAPVLFIGAMLGGAIGGVAHIILPHHTASPGAYALVGMGALFAGIIRTPMTSVVLVFEITRDYAIIVPLMIANLVSYFISRKVTRESLYEGLTRQEGFHLPSSGDHSREDARRVFQILRPPEDSLPAAMTVAEASSAIGSSRARSWLVMDQNGVRGVLSTAHLRNFLADRQSDITLGDLFESPVFPHLHRDHSFDLALERMGHSGLDQLPVVSRFNVRELLGVVRLQDILAAYHVVPAEADKAVEKTTPTS